MNLKTTMLLYWAPRILGILVALFLSVLALDVFDEHTGIRQILPALLIQLIPTYAVMLTLVIAWRWECVGALLFTLLGVAYIIFAWGRFGWLAYLIIAGPLILVGALFLLSRLSGPSRFPDPSSPAD